MEIIFNEIFSLFYFIFIIDFAIFFIIYVVNREEKESIY